MKRLFLTATIALAFASQAIAADAVKATIHADKAGAKINSSLSISARVSMVVFG